MSENGKDTGVSWTEALCSATVGRRLGDVCACVSMCVHVSMCVRVSVLCLCVCLCVSICACVCGSKKYTYKGDHLWIYLYHRTIMVRRVLPDVLCLVRHMVYTCVP